MVDVPEHLGGHMGVTHVDSGILKYFRDVYQCKTMVDIGCGPGGQVNEALKLGYVATGIDGDPSLTWNKPCFIRHDYESGPLVVNNVDLVWSCEFVEHVKPEFVSNFMATFNCSDRFVAMTFAPPGYGKKKPNHKHFNEQHANYWIDTFSDYGWKFNADLTSTVRKASTMKRNFFRHNGLVFSR